MRCRPLLPLLPLLLALSACWMSMGTFYTADPALPSPFTTGRYRSGDDRHVEHVVRLPDGRVRFADSGDDDGQLLTFQPLAVAGRRIWVMQMPFGDAGKPATGAIYSLAEQLGDGRILVSPVSCRGNEALARAAGATIDIQGSTCTFPTRAALEQAATVYLAKHDPIPAEVSLTRVGD